MSDIEDFDNESFGEDEIPDDIPDVEDEDLEDHSSDDDSSDEELDGLDDAELIGDARKPKTYKVCDRLTGVEELMSMYEFTALVAAWAKFLEKHPEVPSVSGSTSTDIISIAEDDVRNAPEKIPVTINRDNGLKIRPELLIQPHRHHLL